MSITRTRCRPALAALAALTLAGWQAPAAAQASDPFLGQIMCGIYNFTPRGWAPLNGQLLSIAQNSALFALIGTTYGGNGQTTFGLPDMRGRFPMHVGNGPGLTPRTLGESSGTETVSLTTSNLPPHTHSVTPLGSNADATQVSPANGVPATKGRTTLYAPGPGTVTMAPTTSGSTGGNQPVNNMPPYVVVNCYIAVQGVFPSRD